MQTGDVWYSPPGVSHSIQGLKNGCEFLLVFDDGEFSENSTFPDYRLFAHTPKDVLEANFGVPESEFAHIPDKELYIFQDKVPGPLSTQQIASPQAPSVTAFTHRLQAQQPVKTPGGSVRIVDFQNFAVSKTREMHWHPNDDEWQYYLEGKARVTVFASGGKARTFNFQAG